MMKIIEGELLTNCGRHAELGDIEAMLCSSRFLVFQINQYHFVGRGPRVHLIAFSI
jgi:hypothetical protein